MDKTAHIFVTGHKELVGAAVLRRLKAEGCKNILTTDIDLTDAEAVNNFFKKEKPAYVIAAAGRSGGIMENRRVPADFMHDNLSIALNILEAAHRNGVQKLVYLCSSCMYPSYCPQPMKEDQLFSGRPDENSLPTAVSKLAALQLCLSYNQQYGATRFIPAIPNNTYGPEDDFDLSSGHVLAALIRRFHEAKKKGLQAIELWGSGTPRREFVHADDVAAACLLLLQAPLRDKDLPINIGTGQDCTIR